MANTQIIHNRIKNLKPIIRQLHDPYLSKELTYEQANQIVQFYLETIDLLQQLAAEEAAKKAPTA